MSKRKQFLDSVHHEHVQDFLNFIKLHKDGADPFDLVEILAELQKSQRQDLWDRQLKLLQHSLTLSPSERWITGAEEDAGDMELEVSEEQIQTMAVIEGVTIVSTVSVDALQENDNYTTLLNCAQILNSIESALPLSQTPLQQAIHWLFECWWRRDCKARMSLAGLLFLFVWRTLLHLINRSASSEDSVVYARCFSVSTLHLKKVSRSSTLFSSAFSGPLISNRKRGNASLPSFFLGMTTSFG
ncbi:condensin-2 complex subunit G2-like [Danio aesculapii]|uniref:condensin-2 complex subunit G2-like n=1 Tax=Danio aesculapii TaxID=1142201 RepID=UPI0024BF21EB|nr:condensin-2 complex subunit G2-like [Danio aesculapii]